VTDRAQMTKLVRVSRSGRITIPVEFRKQLGIDERTHLRMTLTRGELRISPVESAASSKGSPGLRALYEYFAPVREEILARGISEVEVNADIDAVIAEVRAEQRAKKK
jgi:bifunctional DNA-binding transcriptional regulator/antitoxin component of YhaV-PrlF toxin-antitoxin module